MRISSRVAIFSQLNALTIEVPIHAHIERQRTFEDAFPHENHRLCCESPMGFQLLGEYVVLIENEISGWQNLLKVANSRLQTSQLK